MNCSIAVYPSRNWRRQSGKWEDYLKLAGRYGFGEVFSSIHLPELGLEEQVEMLMELARLAGHVGMELTVDIGGGEISQLLENRELCTRVRSARIGLVRLDYGFSPEQAKALYHSLGIRGFVINASIYSRSGAEGVVKSLRSIDSGMELRACHNFYPRPETGLDLEFFEGQNRIFEELGLITYACIPGKTHPRPPLGLGLPTLEVHRNMDLERACAELVCSPGIGGVMAADEFFSEKELACVEGIVKKNPLALRVQLESGIGACERELLLSRPHRIRYDSSCQLLRSETSREMSRIGRQVVPGPVKERTRGVITVDNEGYGRYSGEVQILLADLEADRRVNCCGRIVEADMWKLDYYRQGFEYRLIEAENSEEIGNGTV